MLLHRHHGATEGSRIVEISHAFTPWQAIEAPASESTIVEILFVFTPRLTRYWQTARSTIVEIIYVFTPYPDRDGIDK